MTKLGLTPGVHGESHDEKSEDKKEDIKIDPKVFTVLQPTVIPVPAPIQPAKKCRKRRSSSLCCYISKCLAIFAAFLAIFILAILMIYGADTVMAYLPSFRQAEKAKLQQEQPTVENMKGEEKQPDGDDSSQMMMMSIPLARIMVIDGGQDDNSAADESNSMGSSSMMEGSQEGLEGRPKHPYEIEGPPMDALNMPQTADQSNPLMQLIQERLMAHVMMSRMMRFRRLQAALMMQEMMQRQQAEAQWRMQQEAQQIMAARQQWAEQQRAIQMAQSQAAWAEYMQRQQWEAAQMRQQQFNMAAHIQAAQAQAAEAERQRAIQLQYWQRQQQQTQQPQPEQAQMQQQQQGPVGWWQAPQQPMMQGWHTVPMTNAFIAPQQQPVPQALMRPHDASPQQIVDRMSQPAHPLGENTNLQVPLPPQPLPSINDRIYQELQQQAQNMQFNAPNKPIWTAITPTPPTPIVDGEKTTTSAAPPTTTENVFKPFDDKKQTSSSEVPPIVIFEDSFPRTLPNQRTTTPEPKLNDKKSDEEEHDTSAELEPIATFLKLFNGQLQRIAAAGWNELAQQPSTEEEGAASPIIPKEIVTETPSVEPPMPSAEMSKGNDEESEAPIPSPSMMPEMAGPMPTESVEETKSTTAAEEPPMMPTAEESVPEPGPMITGDGSIMPDSTEMAPEMMMSSSEETPVAVDKPEPKFISHIPPHAITA